jgi:hypothetical protein
MAGFDYKLRPIFPPAVLAVASASLEVVTDFSFQAKVSSQIENSLQSPGNKALLVIQPTSSGKGKYAREMSRRPGTTP